MRYMYYVQKVYSEYIILKIQFVGMMTQGRDWCQPDCIPNVHLMQLHKYKYANTKIQIRSNLPKDPTCKYRSCFLILYIMVGANLIVSLMYI